ncbi:GatB/YqeY domain-containing protein [Actinoalloteichus hymeniacidonis]|uniref:GatB/YqeY domain-containing protein n=1 Tax=Actinoalloteichus hymeniacidonis TaxID=340345 RepID=A0AAC9MWI0_9PSEU|nr:GatB/YqeY domain-containing protein [Actinoalloteichus hymeniacidonis]AOS61081.1 hypothetical protein TL08_01200 [Actinoalloteichus hymeniacidonis]MBB5910919.1 hypothetical protein [Actinoalloteichus hymeniacidonis]
MAELKARLRAELVTAMKAREALVVSTLRMALTAISTAEVAGESARELTDDEVLKVLAKETKKRDEAATAFADAGRTEQAESERAEGDILRRYLPAQLSDAELAEIAEQAVAEVTETLGERPGQRQMGQVMKIASAKSAGRADGGRVAAAVRALLQS